MSKRTMIIGAGQAGAMVAGELLDNRRIRGDYQLVCFLDDDEGKQSLLGYPVYHPLDQSHTVVAREEIALVIIAIPSATREQINRIVDNLLGLSIQIKIVPGVTEIIEGNVYWRQIREIQPEDLLGREEVTFEKDVIAPFYQDGVVLVTGGGGSIGSELCRQLLQLPVARVIALGHGENSLYRLARKFDGEERLACELCDILDQGRLDRIIGSYSVTHLFHAAAHKHVPLMERFPEEAARNNVLGTLQVAEAALARGVGTFLLVSTDKAVNPTSVMGASKRLAERMVLGMNGSGTTRFVLTRFGNVLGSRGSFLPLFVEQIRQGGPVTVTHPDIERYFMSLREAARLVIKAAGVQEGHVFVMDMGRSVRISELAHKLIRLSGFTTEEIPIRYIGLRPGEKMYEELLTRSEHLQASRFRKLFISWADEQALDNRERGVLAGHIRRLLAAGDTRALRQFLFEHGK